MVFSGQIQTQLKITTGFPFPTARFPLAPLVILQWNPILPSITGIQFHVDKRVKRVNPHQCIC